MKGASLDWAILEDILKKMEIVRIYNNKCKNSNRKLYLLQNQIKLQNLNIKKFYNPKKFKFLDSFKKNHKIIEKELNSILKDQVYWNSPSDIHDYSVFKNLKGGWETSCFYYQGKWNKKLVNKCPMTGSL